MVRVPSNMPSLGREAAPFSLADVSTGRPVARDDFRGSLLHLVTALSNAGVTVLMTSELEDRYTDLRFSPYGAAFLTDAIIVQLPLPDAVDVNAALSSIPPGKDVDALNPRHSIERFVEAPVALAVVEILERAKVDIAGKRAVVVGAGRLVGAPTASLLKKYGADVSMFTLEQGSIEDLKGADIVVLGAGKPGFIKPEHLKKGVALIDAGASEQAGKIRGDADPACAEVASVFSPVPGGVGPVAVAMIFRNLKTLIEKEKGFLDSTYPLYILRI